MDWGLEIDHNSSDKCSILSSIPWTVKSEHGMDNDPQYQSHRILPAALH